MNQIVTPAGVIAAANEPEVALVVQPVVLAGGSGTRLWPLSREHCPKQLIDLLDGESLLEATVRRLDGLYARAGSSVRKAAPLVVSSEELRHMTADRLGRSGMAARVVFEPVARNTAPALTVAALAAHATQAAHAASAAATGADGSVSDSDPILIAMPADHLIADRNAFAAALEEAVTYAARGAIVTLGVPPTRAETGYGYIGAGAALGAGGARKIERFVEKPSADVAESYVASGDYWWNSGIFVVRASVWLSAIAHCRPEISVHCAQAFERAAVDADGAVHLDAATLAACPSDSIDYAVMESIGADARLAGVVVPLVAGWSDVGAWDAVWQVSQKDAAGNVARGRVLFEDSTETFAHSDGRLVACVGVHGVVVVETADAVLVAAKDRVQNVKAIVGKLKAQRGEEAQHHRRVERPWGCYDSIDRGERFQVKRIVVKPGGVLSLQMHHHRAEHWVVVRGTARVTRGDEVFLLSENESTYIPLGVKHRLENPGKTPLEIIEVQSGGYLGEDDIVRFDDQYGRAPALVTRS
ncbi:mannose-1-phosphate guanylyltransferase/mannose-6-phosphate isomerase [Paraburkholderia tropica]|uniref:mannose-1-phosphate guanylyltransferase n=1 Tax=Paraburkholderia tropica TaxID=92647 RepID=A0ABX5MPV6_9BURK|nr:mannose-1-phosphate guanylyltransferase/mannose-6-phosphate isomerase [Paraburkholderia tropica]MDE1142715.1 mannose-1-phosphate guanylyltransferase/mannose-6-phosphate isomerase [Paraburkholderia tropica]PXX14448.1 mannose-1-phosphate guanylyltransferase/mannose-6-phosphate isomerase [Paraburkholderia tropica]PZW79514.1 mannose-1-phosphate guanylyltransferase/mannose-6-phosphate isomerase [Paraburkholderia tropica]